MSAPLRLLQVGLGARGRMWAEVIGSRDDVVCVGAVDPSPEARAAFAEAWPEVPRFAELSSALAATDAEAALLVTPPVGRLAQARRIFAAGLPLLAEKPLSVDLAEATAVVRAAEAAGLPLMVGLNFRFLPVSQALRDLVAGGELGAPGFGQFVYLRNRDGRQPHLNKYPLTMQHPMMLEQSIHHLDLLRFCYGREPVSVSCRTWNPPWSMYAHDSNVSCLITMEGGLEVSYLGTWTSGWDRPDFVWRTDCAGGVVVQRQLFEDLARAATGDSELSAVPIPACRPFYDDTSALLGAFVAHQRGGAELPCSGADHLRTLGLCFAAIESSETGREVEVEAFLRRSGIG